VRPSISIPAGSRSSVEWCGSTMHSPASVAHFAIKALGPSEHALLELRRVGVSFSVEVERWLGGREDGNGLWDHLEQCRNHLAALTGPLAGVDGAGEERPSSSADLSRRLKEHLVRRRAAALEQAPTPLMALASCAELSDLEIDLLL